MPVKYHIRLSPSEQQTLKDLVKSKAAHHKRTHAQILLALDENGPAMCEADVAGVCAITIKTVQRIRKRAVEEGLDIAVEGKLSQRQRPAPKLDSEQHAPLEGWQHVEVTDQRTAEDRTLQIKQLIDVYFPNADCIRLVTDNLNTHAPASLYNAFEPEEARQIPSKLEIRCTPKHRSWLNMAEIELSILSRQCLDRRIPDQETLKVEVAAWESDRNQNKHKMDWRFATEDARVKLNTLYPTISAK